MKDSEVNAKIFVLALLTLLLTAAAFSEPLGEFIRTLTSKAGEG